MAENLKIWNLVREVPKEAIKPISGGRLKGMSDINPVWRLKTLTETYGACGVGWKYEIVKKEMTDGAKGEVAAFVDINLYTKNGEEWSAPIPGTGGSMFVANEKNGLYTSDEAYKMALTDAISVACKALGMGANVYWANDKTKYTNEGDQGDKLTVPVSKKISTEQALELYALAAKKGISSEKVNEHCFTRFRVTTANDVDADMYAIMKAGYSKLKDVDEFEGTPFGR